MYCLSVSLFLSVSPLCPLPEQCLSWTVSPSFTWDFRLVVCFFRINMAVAVHLALNVTNQSASHLPPPTTVWFVWLLFARFYMLRLWQFSLPYATWYKGDKCCCFVQLKGSNWLALYPRHLEQNLREREKESRRKAGRHDGWTRFRRAMVSVYSFLAFLQLRCFRVEKWYVSDLFRVFILNWWSISHRVNAFMLFSRRNVF